MKQQNAWQAFESIERLAQYSEAQIESFALRLLDEEDQDSVFDAYARIDKYEAMFSDMKVALREVATNVLANHKKDYKIEGAKFIPVETNHYDFSGIKEWNFAKKDYENAKINLQINKDYLQIIEKEAKESLLPIKRGFSFRYVKDKVKT